MEFLVKSFSLTKQLCQLMWNNSMGKTAALINIFFSFYAQNIEGVLTATYYRPITTLHDKIFLQHRFFK